MNRLTLLAWLCTAVVAGCVAQPDPWTPDGRETEVRHDVPSATEDGRGEIGIADGMAIDVPKLPDLPDVRTDIQDGADLTDVTELVEVWDTGADSVDDAEVVEVEDDVACIPSCEGLVCGHDGCGGSCGGCEGDLVCAAGHCHPDYCKSGLKAFGCCADSIWLWCEEDGTLEGNDCSTNGFPLDTCGWESEQYTCGGEGADPDGKLPLECCEHDCSNAECGDDGCWGSCGTCEGEQESCIEGKCECQPACDDKECGDDGCDGLCGKCDDQSACIGGECVCTPNCQGMECGTDGCDGECGSCADGYVCTDGSCEANCDLLCAGLECGSAGGKDECLCGSCDDENPCNGAETCSEGHCMEGQSVDCSDVPQCMLAQCNPLTGECDLPADNGADCSDGNACTVGDECVGGECVVGAEVVCAEATECASYQCNPDTGKCDQASEEDGTPCDGDAGECLGGVCEPTPTCPLDVCPDLADYSKACNAQAHCEYTRNEQVEDWHQWDVWVYVPPGSFEMGGPGGEGGPDDERPVHSTTFAAGYFMAKYEATVLQYEACAAAQPDQCTLPSTADWEAGNWGANSSDNGRDSHPQNGLTRSQATALCAWMVPDGRLPSESEWEYAASGKPHRKFPWGETPVPTCDGDLANFNPVGTTEGNGCDSGGTMPVDVGTEGLSWCGLHNAAGNVREWVADTYHNTYDSAPVDGTVWGGAGPGIVRGGGFGSSGTKLRTADRTMEGVTKAKADIGVRCARASTCAPDCAGKDCGDDGCGGSCGECDGITYGFSRIEAGSFWMGSPAEGENCPPGYEGGQCSGDGLGTTQPEVGRFDDEDLHHVTITRDFEMQTTEVTQGEWVEAFPGWNPSLFPDCGLGCPVDSVSWYDALAYANRRSELVGVSPCYEFSDVVCHNGQPAEDYSACMNSSSGGVDSAVIDVTDEAETVYACTGFRLPTEAEWEYAARAGSYTSLHPSDSSDGTLLQTGKTPLSTNLDTIGWYGGNSGVDYEGGHSCSGWYPGSEMCGTHPVASKEANAWGLFDASGNVWELCWDARCSSLGKLPALDPDGAECPTATRAARGGGWNSNGATNCRSAARGGSEPAYRNHGQGLRLVRTISSCKPDCAGKDCGDDGCGGSCGECGGFENCGESGACVAKMVQIPEGEFWMGARVKPCDPDEYPYHMVFLDGYSIDATEVTNQQFAAFLNDMEATGKSNECAANGETVECVLMAHEELALFSAQGNWSTETGAEQLPVVSTTWHGAKAYCQWKCPGCDLCTEAQWEKAARGGCEAYSAKGLDCKDSSYNYTWGNGTEKCSYGNFHPCDNPMVLAPVASYPASTMYGLYDLAGNAREWVADWYAKDYYCDGDAASNDAPCAEDSSWPGGPEAWQNPVGPQTGTERVSRGGSILTYAASIRNSERSMAPPAAPTPTALMGFRCCSQQ